MLPDTQLEKQWKAAQFVERPVEKEDQEFKSHNVRKLTPKRIKQYLDDHVIGQANLKKILSVAIFNHFNRLDSIITSKSQLDKSNVLLLGPTGSGKTLLSKTIATLLDVPISFTDATPLTQSGYVGEDVESCILRLLQASNYDVEKAQKGVVFIDEIDKLAKKVDMGQKDVSGEGVQQGLLRIMEGTTVTVNVKPGSKRNISSNESFEVDTSNILFICSGAFVGIDKIVADRIGKKGSMGFNAELPPPASNQESQSTLSVEPEDLVKYGFIPEFIGRLPVIASTQPLQLLELVRIITEPQNSLLKQYQEIFKRIDMELHFDDIAFTKIAERALRNGTGARGLRRIMESILQDAIYEFPGTGIKRVIIDDTLTVRGEY